MQDREHSAYVRRCSVGTPYLN